MNLRSWLRRSVPRCPWCEAPWETHTEKCAGMLEAERRVGLTAELPLEAALRQAAGTDPDA